MLFTEILVGLLVSILDDFALTYSIYNRDAPNIRPPKITFITETTRPKHKFVIMQTKNAASKRLSG